MQELDEVAWRARAYRGYSPQLTLRALLTGSALGFLLSLTNVYVGLKTGWFLGVNLTACLLTYVVGIALHRLRVFQGPLSILEANCAVSTASSAGYATGTMVVAAFPAMLLLSVTTANPAGTQQSFAVVGLWIFCLGALGCALAIPMKRSMINEERLPFPSGTAAAATLHGLYERGGDALRRARALAAAGVVAGVAPILIALDVVRRADAHGRLVRGPLLAGSSKVFDGLANAWPALTRRMSHAGAPALHPSGRDFSLSDYQIKLDHSPALVFAGMLIGLRIAAWMMTGAVLLVAGAAPLGLDAPAHVTSHGAVAAVSAPALAWRELGIWVGAPMLVASSLVGFVARWRTSVRALSGIVLRGRTAPDHPNEVPARWFVFGLLGSGTGVVLLAWRCFAIPPHYGALAIAMTVVLALVACRSAGESDIIPGGAMGQIMQLSFGVLVPQNVTANLQAAAITSGASHAAADLLNDLKAGYLLGADARRQFVAQALGVVTGSVASTLAYFILVPNALAITGSADHPAAFPAVAAQQWKAVAEVFNLGLGSLHPLSQHAILWGAGTGAALAVIEALVPRAWRRFVPSAMGLGLGFMLPFSYPLSMFVGASAAELARRLRPRWAQRYLMPIAAGGIAGESIAGVLVQLANTFLLA